MLLPLINIECSSLENPPFFGRTPANGWSARRASPTGSPAFCLTINGVAVSNPNRLRVRSQPFEFSPVNNNIFGFQQAPADRL